MHRETARVAEEVQEARAFGRRGHRAKAFLHLETHVAHVEEQPRIDGVEQIHMEARVALAYRTYGSIAVSERHLHGRVLERLARTGEALLNHDTHGIERFDHRIYKFAATRQHFRPEVLYLIAVAKAVERESRETVGGTVHNAVSVCHIEQRRTFFKCFF